MDQPKVLIAVDVQREFGLAPKADPKRYKTIVKFIREHGREYLKVFATKCFNDNETNMFRSGAWTEPLETPESLDFDPDEVIPKYSYGLPPSALAKFSHFERGTRFDIIGYNTDCCVLAVAMQLFDLDRDIRVLTDYCYSSSGEEHHRRGVELLRDLMCRYVVENETSIREIWEPWKVLSGQEVLASAVTMDEALRFASKIKTGSVKTVNCANRTVSVGYTLPE